MSEREERLPEGTHTESRKEAREERLRTLLAEAYPPQEASEALRRRVAEMAAASDIRRRARLGFAVRRLRWTPVRIGLGLAAAAALAFVLVSLAPTLTAAEVLRRAEAAMDGVRSAHVIEWRLAPDGSRARGSETWYQNGRWRMEDARNPLRGTQVFASGKLWIYQPKLNKVIVQKREGPFGYNPSGFSIGAMTRDFARWGWRDRIRVTGGAVAGGRRIRQVVIERATEPARVLVQVDAATDLPLQMEVQLHTDGQWVTQSIAEFRFDEPLPARLFEPAFPKSARVFDMDTGRQVWERRLARGIARQRAGDRAIVIRDLQVNAEGDVFALYTAGKYPDDRWDGYQVSLTDELGTPYLAGSYFQPYMAGNRTLAGSGYVFNGERLEGKWWVPATPQSPWKPRRFTLAFQVAPTNHHGKAPPVQLSYTERASFTLRVDRPASVLLPDYMPFIAFGLQEWNMPTEHARARARYYRSQKRDLPRALGFYRRVIRLRDERAREIGEPIADPQTWTDMGEVLREMGRIEEALQAFERALRETHSNDYTRQEAQRQLGRLRADFAWRPGRPAPEFTFKDMEGRPQSPDRYRGQVLLIDLWNAYDERWRDNLPRLKALDARYHAQGFRILGVSEDCNENTFRSFVRDEKLSWPQLSDGRCWTGEIVPRFGYHHRILVDRRGVIRSVDLRIAELEKAVAELVAEP